MRAIALPLRVEHVRWWTDTAARLALIIAVSVLAAVILLLASGHRLLVVRSGSMAPAIDPGDVLITTMVSPAAVSRGDVVTFRDSTRSGKLVTHRVVTARPHRGGFLFLTRGDANTGTERWSIGAKEKVAALWFRIPDAGRTLALVGDPRVRGGLVALGALLLASSAIRQRGPRRP
jgi:signal peptidase I